MKYNAICDYCRECETKMSRYWILNMSGRTLSDEQLSDIPCPRTELIVHVTTKTIQSFSLLGMAVVGPLVSCWRGKRDWDSIQAASMDYGRKGAAAGLAAGPCFVLMRLMDPGLPAEGAYYRSYQIRCNRNQVRVDRLSYLGAIAGAGAMYYKGGDTVNGLILGLTAGCVAGGLYNACFGVKHK